jgi:hypothetical protein
MGLAVFRRLDECKLRNGGESPSGGDYFTKHNYNIMS